MQSLNKSQKALVTQFCNVTSASEAQAIRFLRAANFSVDHAMDAFFDSGEAPQGDAANADAGTTAEFRKYEDPSIKDTIGEDGLAQLATDLGLDLFSSVEILLMCHKAGATVSGRITLPEWRRLMGALGAKSVADLKSKLPSLLPQKASEPFWTWAYKFNCAEGQRSADKDTVVALLGMLVGDSWPLSTQFSSFLESVNKSLTKDTWTMLLPFMKKFATETDLRSKWTEEDSDAWPSQMDDFKDWLIKGKGKK